ncbi:cytochrome P450 [Ceratobasidium sp. AG-I]|nr:cytochrome P450 [Ceratobasidium sp. AG-I]
MSPMSFLVDNPIIGVPAGLVAFALVRKVYQSWTNPIWDIPGPKQPHWFWGHEMITFDGSCGDAYTKWIDAFGPTYKIKGALFHPDVLVTVDIGALAHIYGKEPYNYSLSSFEFKSPVILPIIERLIGRSLAWAEGDDHKRQRYQLAPFFSSVPYPRIHDRLANHIAATTNNGELATLDITNWTCRATLDVIGRVAFDHDFECGESEDAKAIQRSWRQQVNAGLQKIGFIASAHKSNLQQGLLTLRAFPFIADLPFKSIQAQGEVKMIVKNVAQSIIERGGCESKDLNLLATLVANNEAPGFSSPSSNTRLTTVIIAGNETTAGSLSFAFYELARHPELQVRLREEIVQLEREPTYDDYNTRMPLLDAITKEIFRLHPAIPHMERTVQKDDFLRLHTPLKNKNGQQVLGIAVKAGQLIHIPVISLGRLKSVWGEDAEQFNPGRWLDPTRVPSSSETPQGWSGLFVFSGGPRNCIGYRLAVLEFKVILATYVGRFKFHHTGITINAKFAASLQPYVVGEESKGRQLPLGVSLCDVEY